MSEVLQTLGEGPLQQQDLLLQEVSRTFALTIPQLPQPLRTVVANAYLLFRIVDTIEDESALSAEQKQHFHERFMAVSAGHEDAQSFADDLSPLLVVDATAAERDLIRQTDLVVTITQGFSAPQRAAVDRCMQIMCQGMPSYERKASRAGLGDQAALDLYCYYVAGVVGEMLTSLFCGHSTEIQRHQKQMMHLAPSFGQGLQMVNILKDFWEDHRRGVCWLPRDQFARWGVSLRGIDGEDYHPGFGKAYTELIGIAYAHLRNGLEYTLRIPGSEPGIRRFCLLALALAVQTLSSIHRQPQFRSGSEVKISRRVVANTLLMTRLFARSDRFLRRWFDRLGRGLPQRALMTRWPEQLRQAL